MSVTISLTSAICCRVMSLSSGDAIVASSTSLFWSFVLVLEIADSSALAASSLSSSSKGFSSVFSPSSLDCVTEANSRARDSLKKASARISDSKG